MLNKKADIKERCSGNMGIVLNIQKFCINDGPGIRTIVFLKGCMLDCIWCHNPEGKKPVNEIICRTAKCVNCGICSSVCPNSCHSYIDGVHSFDFYACNLCKRCVEECPGAALEVVGKEYSADEVIFEVLKDKTFYETSGGGVTISGGEPFCQPDFLFEILEKCKENNINTAIETCGYTLKENIIKSTKFCDLYLYDYKLTDSELHKKYTGKDNLLILNNLKLLNDMGKKIILRCPIIPGINDNYEHFKGILNTANAFEKIESVHIEPYHNLGEGKNTGLGNKNYFTSKTPTEDELNELILKIERDCRCQISISK